MRTNVPIKEHVQNSEHEIAFPQCAESECIDAAGARI